MKSYETPLNVRSCGSPNVSHVSELRSVAAVQSHIGNGGRAGGGIEGKGSSGGEGGSHGG